ncbi:unnamed protein product, partial [marine sediment metagenome]
SGLLPVSHLRSYGMWFVINIITHCFIVLRG